MTRLATRFRPPGFSNGGIVNLVHASAEALVPSGISTRALIAERSAVLPPGWGQVDRGAAVGASIRCRLAFRER
jgi:hypothetical protein